MDVLLLVEVGLGAVELGARAHVRERGARGLLHDVAELAGQDEVPLAAHERRLDVEDVAARLRPGESGREADLGLLALLAQAELRLAEERREVVGRDRHGRLDVLADDLAGDLPADGRDLALEAADARLARVLLDEAVERAVLEHGLVGREAVLLDLLLDEELLRDRDLLVRRVARRAG